MGDIVDAQCNCGYQEKIWLGGGFEDFTTDCKFPCYCKDCKSLSVQNLMEDNIVCPKCKSKNYIAYDQQGAYESKGEHNVFSWDVKRKIGRELFLTDGKYICPKCDQFNLRFISMVCYD